MSFVIARNVCFRCHQPGHWAARCPQNLCDFCGHTGHTAACCEMKAKLVVPIPEEKEVVSRTRSKATVLSLADIMFNCHLGKSLSKDMEEQVNALVKSVCPRGVDEYKLAEYVFDTHRYSFMIGDMGHMAVLGYIIKKYISADNDYLKDFLRDMHKQAPDNFDGVCKTLFGLIVVRRKTGTLCFRKATTAI